MKRTTEDSINTYRKIGGGVLQFKNRRIKPGQIFKAFAFEIPEAFKDTIILIDGEEDAPVTAVKQNAKSEYEVKHRSAGWYDVINTEGKPINDKALKKEAAESLLITLTGE